MKQILVMMAVVVLAGCSKDTPEPVSLAEEKVIAIADPIFEKAIRIDLGKYTGKLTEADLAKVTVLDLDASHITDAGLKGLAKLQNIEKLFLWNTQITDEGLKEVAKLQKLTGLALEGTKVTKAGVAELKKALPNCTIYGP